MDISFTKLYWTKCNKGFIFLLIWLIFTLLLSGCSPSGAKFFNNGKANFFSLKEIAISLAFSQGISEPVAVVTYVNSKLLDNPTYPKVTESDVVLSRDKSILIPDFDCDHKLGTISDTAILFALSQRIQSASSIEFYLNRVLKISTHVPNTKRMQWEYESIPRSFNGFFPHACQEYQNSLIKY